MLEYKRVVLHRPYIFFQHPQYIFTLSYSAYTKQPLIQDLTRSISRARTTRMSCFRGYRKCSRCGHQDDPITSRCKKDPSAKYCPCPYPRRIVHLDCFSECGVHTQAESIRGTVLALMGDDIYMSQEDLSDTIAKYNQFCKNREQIREGKRENHQQEWIERNRAGKSVDEAQDAEGSKDGETERDRTRPQREIVN
jgi:hypothetical protein